MSSSAFSALVCTTELSVLKLLMTFSLALCDDKCFAIKLFRWVWESRAFRMTLLLFFLLPRHDCFSTWHTFSLVKAPCFFWAAFSRLFSVVGRSCAHGKRFRKLGPLRTGTMSFFPPELSAVGDFIKVCGKVFNHNCEQRWLRPSIHHTSGGDYFVLNFSNRQNDSSCCVVNYIMICASNCMEFIGIVQICYSWRRVLSGKIFA